jgi:hypothetical protein
MYQVYRDLKNKKNRCLENFVINFYDKIKDKPNVLSPEYLYSRRNKLFSTTLWDNKSFLISSSIKFGLKSGICFEQGSFIQIHFAYGTGEGNDWTIFPEMKKTELNYNRNFLGNIVVSHGPWKIGITKEDYEILIDFFNELNNLAEKFDQDFQKEEEDKLERNKQKEIEKAERIKKEKEQLKESKNTILQKLDSDNNGEIDLIDNDFPKLLSKYQKQIIEIDKNYIHQFVKISNYISTKKNNIQQIFLSIEKINSNTDLETRINLIKNQIHTYNLLIFHSLNMIEALVSEDLITFYEIYENFDKIGIFNSNWENEVSNNLKTINSNLSSLGNKLDVLLGSIAKMEENIVSEIGQLNYSTQESFGELNDSLTSSLKSINSSIDVNNLFTAINTYQLYKINKQTKSLLPKNKL